LTFQHNLDVSNQRARC